MNYPTFEKFGDKPLTYIFPHIPKTGGTSLLRQFEQSNIHLHTDYGALIGSKMRWKDAQISDKDFLTYDLIFGHFPIHRYDSEQCKYIALVRNPIDRCISNFNFHQLLGEKFPNDHSFHPTLGRKILAGEIGFLEYLRAEPQMNIVYRHILGYRDPGQFVLIGQTEKYREFCEQLSDLLGIPISSKVHERKADRDHIITEAERREARIYLADECNWFDRFITDAPSIRRIYRLPALG